MVLQNFIEKLACSSWVFVVEEREQLRQDVEAAMATEEDESMEEQEETSGKCLYFFLYFTILNFSIYKFLLKLK